MKWLLLPALAAAIIFSGFSAGPEKEKETPYYLVGESKTKFMELFRKGQENGYFFYDELCTQLLPEFEGLPYGACNVRVPANQTMVNFQSFDCVTFVESWWAMSNTLYQFNSGKVKKDADPLEIFVKNLNKIRYFGGENCGIAYRIHYFTQQMAELERCGQVFNMAMTYGEPFKKKINYITENSGNYGDFADTEMFKSFEAALNNAGNYFFPLSKINMYLPQAQNGDIIAFATDEPGLDVAHTGIVTIEDGVTKLTHASSKYSKVVHAQSLEGYIKSRTSLIGIFVFRPVFE